MKIAFIILTLIILLEIITIINLIISITKTEEEIKKNLKKLNF